MFIRTSAIAAALAFASLASAQYSVTDLGVFSGGDSSFAYDINESGQVVGFSSSSNGARGFIWDRFNGMQNLGALRNDPSSFALGINDSSAVAGFSGSGAMRTGFDWTQPTGLHDLGTYGDDAISLGIDINSSGQVVGVSGFDGGTKRAFLYDPNSGMSDLGSLGGIGTFARGINSSAQVVGHTAETTPTAFIWDGAMNALPNLTDGVSSTAYAISDQGTTVGWAEDAQGERHAVAWQTGNRTPQMIDGALANWFGSEALGLNAQGQIVGFGTFQGIEEAFMYDPISGAQGLSSLFGDGANGWSFTRAQGINDSGQIVGYGVINGETHGFIAAPVPEPATGLVLLAGAALLRLRKKRAA